MASFLDRLPRTITVHSLEHGLLDHPRLGDSQGARLPRAAPLLHCAACAAFCTSRQAGAWGLTVFKSINLDIKTDSAPRARGLTLSFCLWISLHVPRLRARVG